MQLHDVKSDGMLSNVIFDVVDLSRAKYFYMLWGMDLREQVGQGVLLVRNTSSPSLPQTFQQEYSFQQTAASSRALGCKNKEFAKIKMLCFTDVATNSLTKDVRRSSMQMHFSFWHLNIHLSYFKIAIIGNILLLKAEERWCSDTLRNHQFCK